MLKHCPPIPEKAVNAAEFLVARILTYFETLKIEEFKIDCMTANNEFFFKQNSWIMFTILAFSILSYFYSDGIRSKIPTTLFTYLAPLTRIAINPLLLCNSSTNCCCLL